MFGNWLKNNGSKITGSDTVNISVVINKTMRVYQDGNRWVSYQFTIPELKIKSGTYNMENVHSFNKKVMVKCMEFIRNIIPHPINVNITKLSVIENVVNDYI